MFRWSLLLLGVAICQVTAGPKPESEVSSTRLGFPWINPSLILPPGGQTVTVTTTVQVPLYIVRTTTVWEQGGVSTVYLPGTTQAPYTVYQTSYIYATKTVQSGSGATTSYVTATSYFPFTVTVQAAQQLVSVETVTQFVAPMEFGVTRTIIRECADTFTTTRTRTRTRTDPYDNDHYNNGYLTAGGGSIVSLTEMQTIPPHYLKF